jgi:hypothetical protein
MFRDPLGKCYAIHVAGHSYVGDHKIDREFGIQNGHSLVRIAGLVDLIAAFAKKLCHIHPDESFIFDE